MTSPRGLAGRLVDYFAGLISVSAFFETHPDVPPGGVASTTYTVPAGSFAERKAYADNLAAMLGAATQWRNGYYMAVTEARLMDGGDSYPAVVPAEIHFAPLILASDDPGGDT